MQLDSGRGLNLERAERFIGEIASLPSDVDALEIDLSNCQHIDPGAGWRLGNALRTASERAKVVVRVPTIPTQFSGFWFKHFTRSGLGHALARHAHTILSDTHDSTSELRQYYRDPRRQRLHVKGLEPYLWASENFVYIDGVPHGSLDPNDPRLFHRQLASLFPAVHLDTDAYGTVDSSSTSKAPITTLSPVIELLFEAVQNCYDHAVKGPLSPSTPIAGYLSIRYYKAINHPRALSPELPNYLSRLKHQLPDQTLQHTGAFIEFLVNDDGVGIPARHALSSGLVEEPYHKELRVVASALNTLDSVKLRSQDSPVRGDPGYGFLKIRDALLRLGAFAGLRTGRVFAYFDATSHRHGSDASTDDSRDLFRFLKEPLGYMPGTTLQIILPHRRQSLFANKEDPR